MRLNASEIAVTLLSCVALLGCSTSHVTSQQIQSKPIAIIGWVKVPSDRLVYGHERLTVAELVNLAGGTTTISQGSLKLRAVLLRDPDDLRTRVTVVEFNDWLTPLRKLGIDFNSFNGVLIEGRPRDW